jgi:hypothetical protein
MTKEEYREHMRTYSRETMTSSAPAVYTHPDYQALKAAGEEIIPWLLADMLDPDWHCRLCFGEGVEFVPGWQEAWDKGDKTWPPKSTGNRCPECRGKGHISSWGCMSLLWEIVGRDNGPQVENWMRGKHDALIKTWRKWGEQHGYLPPTPNERPDTFFKWFFGLFR